MTYLYIMVKRFPVVTRVVVSVGLLVAFVSAGMLTILAPIALLGGFLYYSKSTYPQLSARLTALPHWLWLTVGAIALRLPRMSEPMWYDETFTMGLAKLPLDRMFIVINGDVHPPLWYMLSWVTGRVLGWSEVALRFPSLIFGVVSVLLVYHLTLALRMERRVALIAAVLAMMLPGMLYYSVEARGYTLLICAVMGAAIAVLKNRRVLFVGCAVIALYTHNLAWAYFGVISVFALFRYGRAWLNSILVAGAAGLLWFPMLLSQTKDISDGFWLPPMSIGWAITPLLTVTTGSRVPNEMLGIISGITMGFMIWAISSQWRWIIRRENWLWAFVAIGAPAGLAVASALWHNVYIERALLPSVMMLCVLWANALVNGQQGNRRVAYIGLIPALLVALVCFYRDDMSRPATGDMIARACQKADVVYNTSVAAEFLTAAYVSPMPAIWPLANDLNQTLPDSAKNAMGWTQDNFDALPKGIVCIVDVDSLLASGRERDYLKDILTHNSAKTIEVHKDGAYNINIHLVVHK
jgi:hypothetical protein